MNHDKKTETAATETVPFFARQVTAAVVVRTGVRAGAAESNKKSREESSK